MIRFIDHSDDFIRRARNELERAIARGTIRVQASAIDLATRDAYPPASTPGTPPHVRTGTLSRSIDQETFQRSGEFVGRVGTNLIYGKYLELGTSRMAARPYLRPALDMNRNQIVTEIKASGGRIGRGS